MLRPKDKWFEAAAGLCTLAGAIAYYGLHDETMTIIAICAGVLALAWAYLDVMRK